jgi:hypothetical protein
MLTMNRIQRAASVAACLWIAAPAFAQENQQELAKKVVNPLTDVVSVPLQFNWLNDVGPDQELRSLIYFQPVVPMSLNDRWNLIGRWMMPYLSQPSAYGGSSGLGDIMAQAFFSPKTTGTFIWGVGPMFNLPTTTNPTLGYGKWAAGPAVAVVKLKGAMTYGMLANNIWSFASATKDRADVNLGYFQPVIAHTSRNGVTILISTEAIADWNAEDPDDRWSIPINLMVSKLTRFGATPMSIQVGGGYYVAKPSHGADWQLRTTFTLLFPRGR